MQDAVPDSPAPEVPESEDQRAQRMAIVQAFSEIVKSKRKLAIDYRSASGIEAIWNEDTEHYDGIDEANRSSTSTTLKGKTPNDTLREVPRDKPTRSTVFLKITRPYVDAAAARVSDMLLPTDDRNWAIRPTPRPELTALVKAMQEAQQAQPAQPGQPPQAPPQGFGGAIKGMFGRMMGAPAAPAMPGQPAPPSPEMQAAQQADQTIKAAKVSAERAQDEIDDWLVEARYHAEVRKVIESAAKVGTGILKGPVPTLKRKRAATQTPDGWTVEIKAEIQPESLFVPVANFYPDPACGNNIQKGSHTFECDDITFRKLTELKEDDSYIREQIEMCLQEGPVSAITGTRELKQGETASDKDVFQIWYFYGQVSRKDMEAAGCKCSDKDLYPAMVTMVNDRVIKVTLSPLDSGEFPYDVMVWQARPDHWAGTGVSRQMRECQRGANAAVRNLMDNAGLSAGPQIVIDRTVLQPANDKWELTPRKVWYTKKGESMPDVAKAFMIVNIETRQAELLTILQFWLKEAEDVTGLPMLLQGQQGKAPDTVGGMQIMNNNGSTVLRRIARTYDDRVTEPHIGRYYEWLLLYGPDEAKGDFTIDARGSSALVERDMQSQQMVQLLPASLNPAYGLDPELVMREFLKSLRFDPKGLELSDEKKQAMASRPPPEDPRVTAAKIVAQGRDADRQSKERMAEQDRQLEHWIATVDAQLKAADLTTSERQHLEDVKATLTGLVIKVNMQKDLSLGSAIQDLHKHHNPSPQVLTPPTEPAGRADAGKAFYQ